MILRLAKWLAILVVAAPVVGSAALLATGNGFFFTALARTYLAGEPTANVNDHRVFATRTIASGAAQPWPEHERFVGDALTPALLSSLETQSGFAFLVATDGKLFAEHYRLGYAADSQTNSFSMAKTVVTLLLGIAIDEGYIDSVDQPLIEFLPEFADDPFGREATVGSLSTMTSGYDWDEHYYSPFSPTVELYYSNDVTRFVLGRGFSDEPEERFYYSSASTELLAIVITRALKRENPDATLSDYLSEKLWQPLGMNADALWHTDDSGMELGYCCINTNARNFLRLGQLMLQRGRWNDRQLVPAAFIDLMITPNGRPSYGYSTHLSVDQDPSFYAFRGHLGQYVVVVPEHDLVLARLGEQHDRSGNTMSEVLPFYVAEALAMVRAESAQPVDKSSVAPSP
ncbi:MAG: serine hydrolase [Pseudomonadota bacterium]